MGPRRLPELWRGAEPALPGPYAVSAVALLAPPLGGLATQWLPHVRSSGPRAVAVAAGGGAANAPAEEGFCRGIPVSLLHDDLVRGWMSPALGFTAWHLVPLAAHPSTARRRAALLAAAAFVGVSYGRIAYRTRSLAVVSPAHLVLDATGLAPAQANWLADRH